jgi:hypothetical protein
MTLNTQFVNLLAAPFAQFVTLQGVTYVADAFGNLLNVPVRDHVQLLRMGALEVSSGLGPAGLRASVIAPYAPSVVLDCSAADNFYITLTGPLILGFSGGNDGQRILVRFTQDAVGGRLLTLGSMIGLSTDLPGLTLSTAPNKLDIVGFIYTQLLSKYHVTSYNRGF